ncbi:hypothetical protein QTO34_019089 [Cnephaeus nilssonii]|uniref:Uncharacterized protein n=1 Tax=Cnephaeus nilssonii TaxID=3371016 RepID=A0AA40I030_CNENI|nr:hypothetical protein QTO34_019089 [Eptesicus nilssonii]
MTSGATFRMKAHCHHLSGLPFSKAWSDQGPESTQGVKVERGGLKGRELDRMLKNTKFMIDNDRSKHTHAIGAGESVICIAHRGRKRDRELETSVREKHRLAASCTPPTGDVPTTKTAAVAAQYLCLRPPSLFSIAAKTKT